MNTTSKYFLLKILKSSLIKLFFVWSVAFSVAADQCATINFSPSEKNGEKFVTIIAVHNDKLVEKHENERATLLGEYDYPLAEGEHTLVVEQWPVNEYKRLKDNNEYLPINPLIQVVHLNVRANQHYQFDFLTGDDSSKSFKLKKKTAKPCAVEEYYILAAKGKSSDESESKKNVLPEPLEYRLRRIMTTIGAYHEGNGNNAFNNIIPTKFNSIVGIIFDENYGLNGKVLKVLSVFPYSLASKLKLFSGDQITHLNGQEIKAGNKSPDQQFFDYLSTLYIGEKIKINIIRNKVQQTLNSVYVPIISPEVKYHLSQVSDVHNIKQTLINYKTLPAVIQFEFDQLMLEVSDYYRNKVTDQNVISISRDETFDKSIGLSGEKVILQDEVGMSITYVDHNSAAEAFGLEKEDVLVKIKNEQITEENLGNLVESLTNLKVGEKISLTVKRKGQHLTLTGFYQPHKLVAFSLEIDIHSIDIASVTLDKIRKNNKLYYRDKRKGFDKRSRFDHNSRNKTLKP